MRPVILLVALPLVACSGASNSAAPDPAGTDTDAAATRSYAVTGFDAISATGPDDVGVRVGPAASVRATGTQRVLEQLDIVVIGGRLRIGRKKREGFSWDVREAHAKIVVTLPRLAAASISGSGDMTIDTVSGDSFSAQDTGSGDLRIDRLAVGRASLSLSGSGNLKAGGTARGGSLSITGSGDIKAPGLTFSSASISVTGSGSLSAGVAGPAAVNVTGSGDVTLTGGARCTIAKAGSGEVSCS